MMPRKIFALWFAAVAIALGAFALEPQRAAAAVCTIPNTITNGNLVDATPVQQNFNALVNCANNIDWSNIDSAGIYASQIIPINPGTATFGSGQDYTFSNHLIVLGGVVVDSTAVPGSGIAGGNASQEFKIVSNAGAGAANGFDFVTATALPSADPIARFGDTNGQTFLELTSKGDLAIEGGLAFDGTQPDGSSLIGGGATLPFWLISETTGSAGANFAFKDNNNAIPAIVVENASASVIFTVDGIGDVQAKGGLSVDNQTPPPNGESGGTGTTPFEFVSNSNISTTAFEFTDSGASNTNLAKFVSPGSGTVLLIDEHGGLTMGASGQTVVEPTAASFGGTVQMPTVGPNTSVCTDGGSHLIGCNSSSNLQMFDVSSTTPLTGAFIVKGIASLPITNHGYSTFPDLGGSVTVNFPGSMHFSDTSYSVTITGESRNIIYTVQSKSTTGFTINGDVFSNYAASVNVDWSAQGN